MKKAVLVSLIAVVSLALFMSVGAWAERMGGSGMQQGMMGTTATAPSTTEQQAAPQPYGWTGSGMGSGMMRMGSGPMGPGRGGFGGMMGGMGSGMMGMGSGMMGMGSGMMGGMGSGMMGMGSGYGGHGRLLYLQKTLGLTDEQVKTIYSAFSEARKGAIKKAAEIQVARIELQELLRAPKTDMTAVKEKLNEIAKLQTELALARIEKHEKVKSTLTTEQLKKFFQTYKGFMMGGSGPATSEEDD